MWGSYPSFPAIAAAKTKFWLINHQTRLLAKISQLLAMTGYGAVVILTYINTCFSVSWNICTLQ